MFGSADVPTETLPLVILFTSVPSAVSAPCGPFKIFIVGTTATELDDFFASQYTLLQACLATHSKAVHFAAMNCQHSAVKYILVKLSLLCHVAGVQLSLLRTIDGKQSEHILSIGNTFVKTLPLGTAPRLRSAKRLLTLCIKWPQTLTLKGLYMYGSSPCKFPKQLLTLCRHIS